MKHLTKTILILIVVMASVGCDQAAKMIARNELGHSGPRWYFHGIVRLQYAENAGAFLSVGSQLPRTVRAVFILAMTVSVAAGFVALLVVARRLNALPILAFSFLLAGAFGNIFDRIFNDGRVIDFVVVGIGPVHTGIFNVADVLITGGVMLLLLTWVRQNRQRFWGAH